VLLSGGTPGLGSGPMTTSTPTIATLCSSPRRRLDGGRCLRSWRSGIGATQDEAWRNAVLQPEAVGMAGQFSLRLT
jgi:hypothetical protein